MLAPEWLHGSRYSDAVGASAACAGGMLCGCSSPLTCTVHIFTEFGALILAVKCDVVVESVGARRERFRRVKMRRIVCCVCDMPAVGDLSGTRRPGLLGTCCVRIQLWALNLRAEVGLATMHRTVVRASIGSRGDAWAVLIGIYVGPHEDSIPAVIVNPGVHACVARAASFVFVVSLYRCPRLQLHNSRGRFTSHFGNGRE